MVCWRVLKCCICTLLLGFCCETVRFPQACHTTVSARVSRYDHPVKVQGDGRLHVLVRRSRRVRGNQTVLGRAKRLLEESFGRVFDVAVECPACGLGMFYKTCTDMSMLAGDESEIKFEARDKSKSSLALDRRADGIAVPNETLDPYRVRIRK